MVEEGGLVVTGEEEEADGKEGDEEDAVKAGEEGEAVWEGKEGEGERVVGVEEGTEGTGSDFVSMGTW